MKTKHEVFLFQPYGKYTVWVRLISYSGFLETASDYELFLWEDNKWMLN